MTPARGSGYYQATAAALHQIVIEVTGDSEFQPGPRRRSRVHDLVHDGPRIYYRQSTNLLLAVHRPNSESPRIDVSVHRSISAHPAEPLRESKGRKPTAVVSPSKRTRPTHPIASRFVRLWAYREVWYSIGGGDYAARSEGAAGVNT